MGENLDSIIRLARARYPDVDVVIAGMEAPPNLGAGYTDQFRDVFRNLADEHDAELIPFLLEGVAGVDSLNQQDGMHPTARGQQRLAANVWRTLEPVLRRRLQRASSEEP
jgi:acyl-CoA thioesterase-1